MRVSAPPWERPPVFRAGALPWYFFTTLLIFWLPSTVLWPLVRRQLSPPEKKALRSTTLLLTFLTFIMELVYRRLKIWTFCEDVDPLLGMRVAGEPVEEFSFWTGATPFLLLVYLLLRSRRAEEEGHGGG